MINWKYSLKYQSAQYCRYAKYLKLGFYQSHHFYVLPDMPEKFRERVVYLPESEYLKTLIREEEPSAAQSQEFDLLMNNLAKKYRMHIDKLKTGFLNHKAIINQAIKLIFPLNDIPQIIICPILFGTVGSYNFDDKTVYLYPRFDRTWEKLIELANLALTHYFYFPHGIDHDAKEWANKQQVASDKYKIVINKMGIKSRNIIEVLINNQAGRLAHQSFLYLKRLGISGKSEVKDERVKLTKSENQLYKLLQNNINQVVSTDDIAKTIWGNEWYEKYSPYAISKLVWRLRLKIKINADCEIHAQRKCGYILYNCN